jgi:YesN/AraC family two-component response regulator
VTEPIRLLITDDHPIVRDGLRGAFVGEPGIEVVGEAGNGAEALAMVGRHRPDVVLMDLRMPVMDGVTAIRKLREDFPAVG